MLKPFIMWRWWTPRALSLSPFTIRVWRVPHRSPLLRRELIALLQGCYALLTFVASQPFMYGQATDIDFMCRSITLAGTRHSCLREFLQPALLENCVPA